MYRADNTRLSSGDSVYLIETQFLLLEGGYKISPGGIFGDSQRQK
jgi:hypothetical protein